MMPALFQYPDCDLQAHNFCRFASRFPPRKYSHCSLIHHKNVLGDVYETVAVNETPENFVGEVGQVEPPEECYEELGDNLNDWKE